MLPFCISSSSGGWTERLPNSLPTSGAVCAYWLGGRIIGGYGIYARLSTIVDHQRGHSLDAWFYPDITCMVCVDCDCDNADTYPSLFDVIMSVRALWIILPECLLRLFSMGFCSEWCMVEAEAMNLSKKSRGRRRYAVCSLPLMLSTTGWRRCWRFRCGGAVRPGCSHCWTCCHVGAARWVDGGLDAAPVVSVRSSAGGVGSVP